MRIRRLIQASLALTIVMVLGLAVANWSITAKLAEISVTEDRAQSCGRDISYLLVMTQEYAMYSEERSVQQWKTLHGDIVKKLEASVHNIIPPPVETLKAAQKLPEVFQQLVTTVSKSSDLQNRQRNLLLNQLQSDSQLLADSVFGWNNAIDVHRHKIEQSSRLQSIVIPLIMLLILMILTFLLNRRLLRPLAQLGKAVNAVAKGDLTVRSATASNDEFGELSRTFDAMAIDLVTEMQREIIVRKLAEENLENMQSLLSEGQKIAHMGTFEYAADTQTTVWSDEEYRIYGLNPEEPSPSYDVMLAKFIHPDDADLLHQTFTAAMQNGSAFELVHRIVRPDGTVRWVHDLANPYFEQNNKLVRYVGVTLDFTERKQAEEEKQLFEQQLQHTQKLESLGVLAGGIAHDFNNILAIIKGNCSLATMDSGNTENYINEIDKASDRAAALCRQMLAYAGKAQLLMAQVNMWMLVDEMITMLKSTLPQNAVIKPELQTNIPFITADASQIRQIVMNLIINASEAIGIEQGEVKISLTTTTVIAGQAEMDYHGKAILQGVYACLEVTDTGCGMDEETKWRIFEPFYTTKFTGRGLGMSAVLGIINSHKGALQLFSQLGQGTTFKVYLPAQTSNSAGEEDKNQSVPPVQWQGSGTILLVEDEKQLRFLAKSMLEMFGFTVLEAVNGKEALELYQKNAAEISLVLTDMGMPVMDGYALFPALKQLNHELPIIISSGFGDADVTSRIGRDNIAGIINKPYNLSQLREVLKSVMKMK